MMSHVSLTRIRHRSLRTDCVAIALCAVSAASCGDLEGFNSKPDEAYCGTIGLPLFQEGFVEEGSPSTLELAVTLDVSKLPTIEKLPTSRGF